MRRERALKRLLKLETENLLILPVLTKENDKLLKKFTSNCWEIAKLKRSIRYRKGDKL